MTEDHMLTKRQLQDFEALTRQIIEWLNKNCQSHAIVTIDPTSAVLSEALIAYTTNDYVSD